MQTKSLAFKENRSIIFKSPSCKRIQDRRAKRSKNYLKLAVSTKILFQSCLRCPLRRWLVVSRQLHNLLLPLLERRLLRTSFRLAQRRNLTRGNRVCYMKSILEKRLPQWVLTVSQQLSLKNWHLLTSSMCTQTALLISMLPSK